MQFSLFRAFSPGPYVDLKSLLVSECQLKIPSQRYNWNRLARMIAGRGKGGMRLVACRVAVKVYGHPIPGVHTTYFNPAENLKKNQFMSASVDITFAVRCPRLRAESVILQKCKKGEIYKTIALHTEVA